ncbi:MULTISPECIES: hypothetical protein [Streptomyces]|uniref:hypothetical protein n=1 Tax=Streptomyces TaxID=1883 RepID=UPI000B9DF4AB|nr:hypothetical protein [Streptomyces kasugaensis]
MNLRYATDRAIVVCDRCPGQPVLPTHDQDTDTRRCVRCQGKDRWLPEPHPDDHLCKVCKRECPGCRAATSRGGLCRACKGLCSTCGAPVPERPDYAESIKHVKPEDRKDHRHKWSRTYFPQSWNWNRCGDCQEAASSKSAVGPVRRVLAALPEPVLRACGGSVPPTTVDIIQHELQWLTPAQLAARIERRWWRRWAASPLHRTPGPGQGAYQPDDVATWLVAPTECAGRCEDGWLLAPPERPDLDDTPCRICRGGRLLTAPHEHHAVQDDEDTEQRSAADRTPAEAVSYRPPMAECTGKGGACGLPVAPPHTQCPSCLNWPWCSCRQCRYDPSRATACRTCSAGHRRA